MRVNVTWDQEDAAILLAARSPLGTAPAARLPRAEWLARAEPAALRVACGLTLGTLSAALGVPKQSIWRWETGQRTPRGAAGARYCRVIEGLARHMEVQRNE